MFCKNVKIEKRAGIWKEIKFEMQYICPMGVGGVFLASIVLCVAVAIVAEIVERIK